MIDITNIKSYYSSNLHLQDTNIVREFLQYKILKYIFSSKMSSKLCFIGGTALRIVYSNQRFSEDLDFDNFGLSMAEFEEIMTIVQNNLELEGFEVELRYIYKGAYHCYIKIPKVLYELGLAPMETQKIVIQVDTVSQGYDFEPNIEFIQKFDVVSSLNVASINLLLSHKLHTIFNRKRAKGRDFFDIIFLLGRTKIPDWGFLKKYDSNTNSSVLKSRILSLCDTLDFELLQKDVSPFLFNPDDNSVLLFPEYIKNIDFEE